jgi:SAM-dependent methyltransferase
MRVNDYLTLWRLAKLRQRSEADYRALQGFQCSLLCEHLLGFGIELEGKRVLDLGSGIGGYGVHLAARGARVVSLDLVEPTYTLAKGHTAVVADALSIPLEPGSADFVFCASLIEHVRDPSRLLTEIQRVLIVGGHCYLSFPPFYSPQGGHEYSPLHYFGERFALRLLRRRARLPAWVGDIYRVAHDPQTFAETYEDWGLFKMTIAKAKRLIANTDMRMLNMSTRYQPLSMIRWPLVGEVMTWHAQFLLEKPPNHV